MFHENAETGRGSMMGLSYGEQLVVWGIRKIVGGKGSDPDLLTEFQAAFGSEGEEGLRIFCSFFRLLGQAARKPYEIAPPGSLQVLPDERRMLTLIAAAQRSVTSGDPALLQAHLLWLAAADHRPALARIAQAFASLLQLHGHPITVACDAPAPESNRDQAKDSGWFDAVASKPRLAWGR